MKPTFIDVDEPQYYESGSGEIFDKNKRRVSLVVWFNIKKQLRDLRQFEEQSAKANYKVGAKHEPHQLLGSLIAAKGRATI